MSSSSGNYPGVAMIEPVGGHGGMNFYDFELARGLRRAGTRVVLYTCDETEVPEFAGFEIVLTFRGIFGKGPSLVRGSRYVRGLWRSLMHARAAGFRLAHFHFFHSTNLELGSVVLARLFGFRVIITAHDVTSFANDGDHWKGRLIFKLAAAVIAHNRVSCDELVNVLGVPAGKIHVVPSGNYRALARQSPGRPEARDILGLPATAPLFLFFGQIKKVKGLDTLLEAWPAVAARHPEARLVIAGKVWKDDYSAYAEQIRDHGIAASLVQRIGFIPDSLVGAYYAAADVVVLPYRKIYQSAVLLMAMSHARTTVVTDLPGMTEIVVHGETGWVFPRGDSEALSTALSTLAEQPPLRSRLGLAALTLMESTYTWGHVGRATAAIYRQVAGN